MVKIFKIHLQPNIKKTVEKKSAPKLLNVIRLAQFSGIEVSEKSKVKCRESQEILSLFQLQQKLEDSKEGFKEIVKQTFSNVISSGESLLLNLKEKNITQKALDQLKKERLLHKSYLTEIANLISNETKIHI